jgi:hypothetical protein
MGNADSRHRRPVLVDLDHCLSPPNEQPRIVDCTDVLEAMDAARDPDVSMACWALPLTRGETREIPSHGTALLGFRSTSAESGTVHVSIGTHLRYAVHVSGGGQLAQALFGTSALPVGALPRERIVVTAPPTADVEAVYASITGDPYELNYEADYVPWTLHAPSGLVMVAANGKLWPMGDIAELPLQYPASSSSRDANAC